MDMDTSPLHVHDDAPFDLTEKGIVEAYNAANKHWVGDPLWKPSRESDKEPRRMHLRLFDQLGGYYLPSEAEPAIATARAEAGMLRRGFVREPA